MNLRQMSNSTPGMIVAVALAMLVALAYVFSLHKATMPDVKFMTVDGKTIASTELRGKVLLVNFWATTCTACIREMPVLIETYHSFAPRGFEIIAVAMSYDPPSYVLKYAEQTKAPFHVALDPTGSVAQSFGDVRLTPTSFVIDRQGRIAQRILGEPDFAKLHALLDELLSEPS